MNFCCLIPSFNEEKTIGWLVRAVRENGYDVVVVDDGSRDKTAKIASDSGAQVLANPRNLGKGASLRRAFGLLTAKNYDALIIMDGDGQHLPQDIARFVEYYKKYRPGIIIGNRMSRPKGMPIIRWMTNKFMSFMLSRMCAQRIADSQCGFRLIDSRVLRGMNLSTEKFEIESEMLLEAARQGYRIESVPITTVYNGQYSAIHPVKDTLRFLKFVFSRR